MNDTAVLLFSMGIGFFLGYGIRGIVDGLSKSL